MKFTVLKRDVDRVFIHCSASDHAHHDDVKVMRDWHVNGNGWSDVGYHYFITKAGKIIFAVTVMIWILGYFPNYGADLGQSWLGQLGQLVEPVFSPLGLDWRYGVAIFTSFAAREVFVGTLGTIFGIEGADENMVPLVEHIQASELALGSGLALLVFFAISLQCVSTLAILAKESESHSLTLKMFVGYFALAYTAALLVYQLTGLIVG